MSLDRLHLACHQRGGQSNIPSGYSHRTVGRGNIRGDEVQIPTVEASWLQLCTIHVVRQLDHKAASSTSSTLHSPSSTFCRHHEEALPTTGEIEDRLGGMLLQHRSPTFPNFHCMRWPTKFGELFGTK